MGSKQDVLRYPCFQWIRKGKMVKIEPPSEWNIWEVQAHHYISQQFMRKNPKKFKEIEHLQKLFFLPPDMHMDLHAYSRRFKEKWGFEIEDLIYKVR